jgi:hypothetical protein
MRDIRQDLKERLSSVEAKRAEHHAALKQLDQQAAAIMLMLDTEDRRFPEPKPNSAAAAPTKALTDFIYEELGRRRMDKTEIKLAAEQAGYGNVGRPVHLTLVNLARFGRISIGPDQKYERPIQTETPNSGTLFGAPKINGPWPLNP